MYQNFYVEQMTTVIFLCFFIFHLKLFIWGSLLIFFPSQESLEYATARASGASAE